MVFPFAKTQAGHTLAVINYLTVRERFWNPQQVLVNRTVLPEFAYPHFVYRSIDSVLPDVKGKACQLIVENRAPLDIPIKDGGPPRILDALLCR